MWYDFVGKNYIKFYYVVAIYYFTIVGNGTAPCSSSITCKTGVNLYCDLLATVPSCKCYSPWTLDVTYTSPTYMSCICTTNAFYHLVGGTSCRNLVFISLTKLKTKVQICYFIKIKVGLIGATCNSVSSPAISCDTSLYLTCNSTSGAGTCGKPIGFTIKILSFKFF